MKGLIIAIIATTVLVCLSGLILLKPIIREFKIAKFNKKFAIKTGKLFSTFESVLLVEALHLTVKSIALNEEEFKKEHDKVIEEINKRAKQLNDIFQKTMQSLTEDIKTNRFANIFSTEVDVLKLRGEFMNKQLCLFLDKYGTVN